MASIFETAWVPLRAAVAWVMIRDQKFVERSSRAVKSLRSITTELADDQRGMLQPHFENPHDAWVALREKMAAGRVRASGTPFRRVAGLNGTAFETSEAIREIPCAEIGATRLRDDGEDKDCLVPEDWRVAHGSNLANLRGYRDVRVFRENLFQSFGAEAAGGGPSIGGAGTEVSQMGAALSPKSRGAKTRGIEEALDQEYPNGIPIGLIAKHRNIAIEKRLQRNGSSIPIDLPRAIQRVLKARGPQ